MQKPLSRYAQRQHARYERCRSRLVDIYRSACCFHSTHEQILDRCTTFWQSNDVQRLTIGYRDMLREVQRCHADALYQYLDWRMGTVDGPIAEASTNDHDWSTGRLSELSRTPGALYGAHYWIGTDRPFGEWKPIN
jgi:hypothetical protein